VATNVPLQWNEEAYAQRDIAYGERFFLAISHDDGDHIFDIRNDTIVAHNGSFVGVAVQVQ
jgi:hypothetical protein